MGDTKRIAKWDNVKFFLMLSVVIGHVLYNFRESSDLAKGIYLFIYTYHMPVFIFIAGLFSKSAIRKKRYERVFEYIFIYIFMKFLEAVGQYLLHRNTDGDGYRIGFRFFYEDSPAWFGLAMAAFLLCTMMIQDIDKKYVLGLALLVGCAAGLDTHLGNHLASLRICVFYPVFLAGFYLDPQVFLLEKLNKINKILIRICSLLAINILIIIIYTQFDKVRYFIDLLKGKFDYYQMKMAMFGKPDVYMGMKGVPIRAICYVFWAVMIIAVILFNTEGQRIYTWLGKRTMSIFIWHNFIITVVFKVFKLKRYLNNNLPHYQVFAAMCIAAIICVISAYLPEIRVPAIKREEVKTE